MKFWKKSKTIKLYVDTEGALDGIGTEERPFSSLNEAYASISGDNLAKSKKSYIFEIKGGK